MCDRESGPTPDVRIERTRSNVSAGFAALSRDDRSPAAQFALCLQPIVHIVSGLAAPRQVEVVGTTGDVAAIDCRGLCRSLYGAVRRRRDRLVLFP